MTPEIFPDFEQSRSVHTVLNFLTGHGRGIDIGRTGGGVRVAVIPIDVNHPEITVAKYIEMRCRRDACRMPFDDPHYQAEN